MEGDFNLRENELDEKCRGKGTARAIYEEGEYTFKSDVTSEHRGKCIDHVLSRGYECRTWDSQDGSFIKDHMPIVAEIDITGHKKSEGRRLKQVAIPTLGSGDEGAKRRLMKELDRLIVNGLEGWTHEKLVIWTAKTAKLIAKSRN